MNIPKFKELWQDFKAYRRGERRVAPYGTRGRVYAPKIAKSDPGSVKLVTKEPTASVNIKITRADGSVETMSVPAKVKRVNKR